MNVEELSHVVDTVVDNHPAVSLAAVLCNLRHGVEATFTHDIVRNNGLSDSCRRLGAFNNTDTVQLSVGLDDVRVVNHRELLAGILATVKHKRLRAARVIFHELGHIVNLAVHNQPAVLRAAVLRNLRQ